MTTGTPQQVLEETARRIERGQWGQGLNGPCVLHVRLAVAKDLGYLSKGETTRALRLEIFGINDMMTNSIAAWNDAPGRTKEEVAATVRNAKRWL